MERKTLEQKLAEYRARKRARLCKFIMALIILIGSVSIVTYAHSGQDDELYDLMPEPVIIAEPLPTEEPTSELVLLVYEEPEPTIQEYPEPVIILSDEDEDMILRMAMAEAEGEDVEGKALVICVILNRVADGGFPDTIYDVIYQPRQFSPVDDGRFDAAVPNEDCYEALDMVIFGWDESQGALYFENCRNEDNWHSRNLEHLFTHGRHKFYK